MESIIEHHFIGLLKKVDRFPEHPEMFRLQMDHKIFMRIPFFKKKISAFILDTPAEFATLASLLPPCRNKQSSVTTPYVSQKGHSFV